MNIFSILEEIQKVDPEMGDRFSPRRDVIKNITSFGSKVAVAALPFAMGTLFKKAYGQQSNSTIAGILNYALTLEHLESAFYNAGVAAAAASTLTVPSSDLPYLKLIQTDENNHVNFLTTVITSLGATPVSAASYDFTAKGTFPTALTSYATFLSIAVAFEDTGVRAYKGQAPNLIGNQTILTAALGIHAVEARHASAARYLLHNQGVAIKSWISGSATVSNDTGIAAVNGNYAGENNTMQGGVDVSTLAGANGASLPFTAAIECFDEPLDMATVVGLVTPFFN